MSAESKSRGNKSDSRCGGDQLLSDFMGQKSADPNGPLRLYSPATVAWHVGTPPMVVSRWWAEWMEEAPREI